MPVDPIHQNYARKALATIKSLPTKVMTSSQQKKWEELFRVNANKVRLIDIFYKKIADYEQKYLRNVKKFENFKKLDKNAEQFLSMGITIGDRLDMEFPEELAAYRSENGHDPESFQEFNHYLSTVYLHDNPEKVDEFYKNHPELDARKVVPPEILKHVNEYLQNKVNGEIQIIKDASTVKNVQKDTRKQELIKRRSTGNKLLTPDELEGILYGKAVKTSDDSFKVSNDYGKGLMYILEDDFGEEARSKRFEIMKNQIAEFPKQIQIQIVNALLADEQDFEEDERLYNRDQLTKFISELKNKKESKEFQMKSLTETFYDLIGKRLDDKILKEDDTPADFATGVDNSATQGTTDTSTPDTSTDTTSSTTGTDTPTDDFDYTPDNGGNDIGNFGGITGPSGSATIPDDDSDASMNIPVTDYRVIDVLVNNKDTSQVKVKIQNTETKETEIVDLSEIDV